MAFLPAHWKLTAAIAAVALAFAGGRLSVRPQVRVQEKTVTQVQFRDREVEKKVEVAGPVHVVERWKTLQPPAAECHETMVIEHERITDKGVVSIASTLTQDLSGTQASQTDLQLTPAPRASWAVYGGLAGIGGDRRISAGLERRLFGPFWIAARVQPSLELKAPPVDLGLRFEW